MAIRGLAKTKTKKDRQLHMKMKARRSKADGVSGYRNNVYYVAASCGELDPKKVVCASLCGSVVN
jgi:hypothetical protein